MKTLQLKDIVGFNGYCIWKDQEAKLCYLVVYKSNTLIKRDIKNVFIDDFTNTQKYFNELIKE